LSVLSVTGKSYAPCLKTGPPYGLEALGRSGVLHDQMSCT